MKLIKNNCILLSILLLSFLGFLDATYLAILHYKNAFPPCTITHGCEKVLTSKFATIGSIPIALMGSLYYLTLIILTIYSITNKKKESIKVIFLLSVVGILVSLLLIYLQFFVIGAFCQYCIFSEVVMFSIFALSAILNQTCKNK